MRSLGVRRGALLAVILAAMLALKHHYSVAPVERLTWILGPTAQLVALATRTPFAWEPGAGYMSREQMFLIEKPCAGINFMIAALGMLGLLLSRRPFGFRSGAAIVATSLGLSYVAAVLVNAVRIVFALWLAAHPLVSGFWTGARVHRLEGIVVYFGGLLLLQWLVRAWSPQAEGRSVTC
jgi:exosortase K